MPRAGPRARLWSSTGDSWPPDPSLAGAVLDSGTLRPLWKENTEFPADAHSERHNAKDREAYRLAEKAFSTAGIGLRDKQLEAFPRFVSKRALARFIVKERLFNEVLDVAGIVVTVEFKDAEVVQIAELPEALEPQPPRSTH